jgi:hypothetical protein
VAEGRRKEESWRVCSIGAGEVAFYRMKGVAVALGAGRRRGRRSKATKGQGMGSEHWRRRGGADALRGEARDGVVASSSSSRHGSTVADKR